MTKDQYKVALEAIEVVNTYFETDCRIKSRKMNVVRPRMYACKVIRELTGMIYQEIGDLFGLGHDNIIHYMKSVDRDLETDSRLKTYYVELMSQVETSKVFKGTRLGRSHIERDLRIEVFNALMSKDVKQLNKILKIIT
jgi:hypothetical protein